MDKFRLSLIVFGVVAVAILAGGWALGIQPQLNRIGAADSQTASIRQINNAQEAENAALAADNANLAQYKADLAADEAQIPTTRSQQALIDQINGVASAAGVTVQSLVFDQAMAYAPPAAVPVSLPTAQTLVTVPISISVSGPRPSLEAFAAALQGTTRIITISASSYTGPDESALSVTGTTWVMQAPAS